MSRKSAGSGVSRRWLAWALGALLPAWWLALPAWAGPGGVPSPLIAVDSDLDPSICQLVVDQDGAARVRALDALLLEGFVLDARTRVDLLLERTTAFAPDARIVSRTQAGDEPLDGPTHDLYRGRVAGDDDSWVVLAFDDFGVNGIVDAGGRMWVISSGEHGRGLDPVVYEIASLPEGVIEITTPECRAAELPRNRELVRAGAGEPAGESTAPCRRTRVAIETDRKLLTKFGGNATAMTNYVELLVAANTEIYRRDVNIRFEIGYLSVYPGEDPWNTANSGEQLGQLRDYWVANNEDIERDLVHMFSARLLGGGVAWVDTLCGDYGYAVSGNLRGGFPYPLQDYAGQNWDVYVTAHEWGHNMGTGHTHDYDPPIDACGLGDCSVPDGTIMSYCHGCPGGTGNIRLGFSPRVIERILNRVSRASCDIRFSQEPTITAEPASVIRACEGERVELAVEAVGEDGTGDGLSYRWLRNGQFINVFSNRLVINDAQADYTGTFSCRVQGDCGTVYTQPALLIVEACSCAADLTGSSDPNDPSFGVPDGDADGDDFFYYLDAFTMADLGVCDLTGSSDPNDASFGTPDGDCDGDDFFSYLDLFVAGCG
ncbi:MAG: M12 family metallo-peptidase [Phycisphaerales bacterium JB037]